MLDSNNKFETSRFGLMYPRAHISKVYMRNINEYTEKNTPINDTNTLVHICANADARAVLFTRSHANYFYCCACFILSKCTRLYVYVRWKIFIFFIFLYAFAAHSSGQTYNYRSLWSILLSIHKFKRHKFDFCELDCFLVYKYIKHLNAGIWINNNYNDTG